MKKEHLPLIGLALILLVQGYLMWKINEKPETNLEVLKAAQKVSQGIDSVITQNNRLIERYDDRIARQVDTLKIYERQKTQITNNYAQDLSFILRADRGTQFELYKRNSRGFDSTFAAGFFTGLRN